MIASFVHHAQLTDTRDGKGTAQKTRARSSRRCPTSRGSPAREQRGATASERSRRPASRGSSGLRAHGPRSIRMRKEPQTRDRTDNAVRPLENAARHCAFPSRKRSRERRSPHRGPLCASGSRLRFRCASGNPTSARQHAPLRIRSPPHNRDPPATACPHASPTFGYLRRFA